LSIPAAPEPTGRETHRPIKRLPANSRSIGAASETTRFDGKYQQRNANEFKAGADSPTLRVDDLTVAGAEAR
jgi:hypothetical protein